MERGTSPAPAPVQLAGLRVLVMGLGQFGGGIGVTRFLHRQGARVLVTDQSPATKLEASLAQLQGLPIDYRLAGHDTADFTGADLIVVNPAVTPANNPYLVAAQQAGVPLTSEIRLLTQRLPSRRRTIGITGSAGKSTTTAMVGHVMNKFRVSSSEFRVASSPTRNSELETRNFFLGGNIGGSLLNSLDQIRDDDWVVLELSSFMLEGLREDRWSPHIALITNIAPNHLDWHGSMAGYRHAKQAILDFQEPDDIAILGPGAAGFTSRVLPKNLHDFSHAELDGLAHDIPPLLIPGGHNRVNAAIASALCTAAGIGRDDALAALATFPGLEHRLQFVAQRQGVRYFNDSKCTTPEAAMLALRSFEPGIVHVILGGYDKGADLSLLAAFARCHCRAIHTIGITGPVIAAAAQAAVGPALIQNSATLPQAMRDIQPNLRDGDVVLLSPACASWDQFTHFEARGQMFVELVDKMAERSPESGVQSPESLGR